MNTENEQVSIEIDSALIQNAASAASNLSKLKPLMDIKLTHKDFRTVNESCRGIFLGFTKMMNKRQQQIDAIMWMEEGGQTFYNCGTILVGDCRNFKMKNGVAFEITYLGKKPLRGGGDANNFRVSILSQVPEGTNQQS